MIDDEGDLPAAFDRTRPTRGEIAAGDHAGGPEPVPPGVSPLPRDSPEAEVHAAFEMAVFDQALPVRMSVSLADSGMTFGDPAGWGRTPPQGLGPARGVLKTTPPMSTAR
jgi:hypothetical protein